MKTGEKKKRFVLLQFSGVVFVFSKKIGSSDVVRTSLELKSCVSLPTAGIADEHYHPQDPPQEIKDNFNFFNVSGNQTVSRKYQ